MFVQFPRVSTEMAEVRAQVHVQNADVAERRFRVHVSLLDAAGRVAAEGTSEEHALAPAADVEVVQSLEVARPALWSPRQPNLYTLRSEVIADGAVVDQEVTRVGIRRIEISPAGFSINGEVMYLRGTNRHQEYPFIGHALSNAAQYRDAAKIKQAGFDYVRLAHFRTPRRSSTLATSWASW